MVFKLGDKELLSPEYVTMILVGITSGMIARLITLYVDFRQTPTFPNGVFNNIVTGFIASCLGAVAIPALVEKEFTAITFLALATQHFRDIRKIEAESLQKLDDIGFTKRGDAYIDGIAKTYEARHYISMISALAASVTVYFLGGQSTFLKVALALVIGLLVTYLIRYKTKGKNIGDICTIREGTIRIDGSELFVDDLYVTSILGTPSSKEMFLQEGLAVVITPNEQEYRVTIDNEGQRQAMLFEAGRTLGIKQFSFTRRSFTKGVVIIAIVPIIKDIGKMIDAVKHTPVLENSRKVRRIMRSGG